MAPYMENRMNEQNKPSIWERIEYIGENVGFCIMILGALISVAGGGIGAMMDVEGEPFGGMIIGADVIILGLVVCFLGGGVFIITTALRNWKDPRPVHVPSLHYWAIRRMPPMMRLHMLQQLTAPKKEGQ